MKIIMSNKHSVSNSQADDTTDKIKARRAVLGKAVVVGMSPIWVKPVVNSVILPTHAQTSMCVADMAVGGPLSGNPSGATTCQAACDAEATARNAQLCAVIETPTATGTDCTCEIDTS